MRYVRGPYNKFNDEEQWIRTSDGCTNHCPFCYCPTDIQTYTIPEIVRNKVRIMDMNPLQAERVRLLPLLAVLPTKLNKRVIHYEFIFGIDYRELTFQFACLLYAIRCGRFNRKGKWLRSIRVAWDWHYSIRDFWYDRVQLLLKAGFKPRQIEVFMICDWKIPYEECVRKLEAIKEWGFVINDCWYDNVKTPNFQCNNWTLDQCRAFRRA
jgi:hypothetical protein